MLEELSYVLGSADDSSVSNRLRGVEPEYLSKIRSIDVETVKRTIVLTTQYCKHDYNDHLTRQYSTNDRMLRYKRISSNFFTDKFNVTDKTKSKHGHKHIQLFVLDKGFVYVVPIKDRKEVPKALK